MHTRLYQRGVLRTGKQAPTCAALCVCPLDPSRPTPSHWARGTRGRNTCTSGSVSNTTRSSPALPLLAFRIHLCNRGHCASHIKCSCVALTFMLLPWLGSIYPATAMAVTYLPCFSFNTFSTVATHSATHSSSSTSHTRRSLTQLLLPWYDDDDNDNGITNAHCS